MAARTPRIDQIETDITPVEFTATLTAGAVATGIWPILAGGPLAITDEGVYMITAFVILDRGGGSNLATRFRALWSDINGNNTGSFTPDVTNIANFTPFNTDDSNIENAVHFLFDASTAMGKFHMTAKTLVGRVSGGTANIWLVPAMTHSGGTWNFTVTLVATRVGN